jgi:hypothetical protein
VNWRSRPSAAEGDLHVFHSHTYHARPAFAGGYFWNNLRRERFENRPYHNGYIFLVFTALFIAVITAIVSLMPN